MSQSTHIQWTERTWNPIAGCSKVSLGCDGCYAIRDTRRLSCNPNPKVRAPYADLVQVINGRWNWTGQVRLQEDKLYLPLKWRKPSRIFVNSMSDLFHESVPDEWIDQIFGVMCAAGAQRGVCAGPDAHNFQILTKRPQRMLAYMADPYRRQKIYDANKWKWGNVWPRPNIWLGVSCEDQATADERIPLLLQTPAALRWISVEPMLDSIDLTSLGEDGTSTAGLNVLTGEQPCCHDHPDVSTWQNHLDWVVVGGESGKAARPMHPAWVRALREQCQAARVPFFFKQWGEWLPTNQISGEPIPDATGENQPAEGAHILVDRLFRGFKFEDGTRMLRVGKKLAGRLLDGREWNEYPPAVNP